MLILYITILIVTDPSTLFTTVICDYGSDQLPNLIASSNNDADPASANKNEELRGQQKKQFIALY